MTKFSKTISWKELNKLMSDWICYGDDYLADKISEYHEEIENTDDEEYKETLKEIIKLLKLLEKKIFF